MTGPPPCALGPIPPLVALAEAQVALPVTAALVRADHLCLLRTDITDTEACVEGAQGQV